jgi:hypothetical protein
MSQKMVKCPPISPRCLNANPSCGQTATIFQARTKTICIKRNAIIRWAMLLAISVTGLMKCIVRVVEYRTIGPLRNHRIRKLGGQRCCREVPLRDDYGALCVELEAVGLMSNFSCLIVRGICDYANSDKNDASHRYVAAIAIVYCQTVVGFSGAFALSNWLMLLSQHSIALRLLFPSFPADSADS